MKRYIFPPEERTTLEHLPAPLAICQRIDGHPDTLVLSDGFLSLFGFPDREQALACCFGDMNRYIHPRDTSGVTLALSRLETDDIPFNIICRVREFSVPLYHIIRATGKHVCPEPEVRLSYITFTDEGPWTESDDLQVQDLASVLHTRHVQDTARSSLYDHLTGLPGMTYFFELAEEGRKALVQSGRKAAILYMDMCGMKFFNRKYGFAEGDRLLCEFSALLEKSFGREHCCRFGSDHFVLYTEAEDLEPRLNRLFADSLKLNGGLTLPVRVGIYLDDSGEIAASTTCDHAKTACDALRNVYTSRFSYYSPEMQKSAEWRQYIITNLDRAIREQWIQVYYQPIVRAVSGKVCDDEALCRWIDPVYGTLSPADFIPVLEEANLIYRLDLCVLDQVLLKIRRQAELGMYPVPQSVNLSRSDFESCDIVEEIRRRVADAGVRPEMITIEITESIIGSKFEFMKEQIGRFQALGFPVWMDDFGSGYSSLDVLQSIRFDLIKFDMGFMKRLNEGESGKIILTQLIRMATSLHIDTICEGVESEEQVHFLREIGCSKLQGYYYSRPVPFETILERFKAGTQIGYENPAEASYYETIGKVNLFDLTAISTSGNGRDAFLNYFDAFPMAVLEMRGDTLCYTRTNSAFRDINIRYFDYPLSPSSSEFVPFPFPEDSILRHSLKECQNSSSPVLFDDKLRDGSLLHAFIRRIAYNPATETTAFVIAILSITEETQEATYSSIARALATDYYHIYYVDIRNDQFIEYSSAVGAEVLAFEKHGTDFFGTIHRISNRIYEEDREMFFSAFTRENILNALESQGLFTMYYRLMDTGEPLYAAVKIVYPLPDKDHIVIGVSIVDAQMKQKAENDRMQQEIRTYGRMIALSDNYFAFYTVDLDTEHYLEFNSSADYEKLGIRKVGENFFEVSHKNSRDVLPPDDHERLVRSFTRENILKTIWEKGSFNLHYRMLLNGRYIPTALRAVLVKEPDGEKLLIGVRQDGENS
ncbi:MAG: EAL domain-containing protein [Clostridia bacterium]|nr:EAL domain-containing protein [Clostridia bacterium]